MRTITKTVYTYDELSEEAKAKARFFAKTEYPHDEWWDSVYEDAKTIAGLFGLTIECINFSGFNSQGDGANLKGEYAYKKHALREVRRYAPKDAELHRIVGGLTALQRRHFYRLTASIAQSGHYNHAYCTTIAVDNTIGLPLPYSVGEDVKQLLRDFMDWIYRRLEKEYDYLTSDEMLAENLTANGVEFDIEGKIH